MCNAWNHPPGCTCGFGGQGSGSVDRFSSGSQQSAEPMFSWEPPILQAVESYTIPNARCPVCSKLVFYYQSPYGGRVFFDEPGPPWPKHPCTDSKSVPREPTPSHLGNQQRTAAQVFTWQRERWEPFFVSTVREVDPWVCEIRGKHLDSEMRIYINKRLPPAVPLLRIDGNTIAYVRVTGSGISEISLLPCLGRPANRRAFTLRADAQAAYRNWVRGGDHTRDANGRSTKAYIRAVCGTVKWFSEVKGYGFVQLDGHRQDVFLHVSVLRHSGIQTIHKHDRVRGRVRRHPTRPRICSLELL